MRALASRSLDSVDVCVGQTHSSPDRRHPLQTGRVPLHLTFRDLQLKQANPYRRAFRADEDAKLGSNLRLVASPGGDVASEATPGSGIRSETEVEGMGDLGEMKVVGIGPASLSGSLAELLIWAEDSETRVASTFR